MSMNSIDALVAHYQERHNQCAAERDRAAGMTGARFTDAHRRKVAEEWEKQRRIARDTIAYLQTIQRRDLGGSRSAVPFGRRPAHPSEPPPERHKNDDGKRR